ncbi:MAG TPA: tRNA uridine-5-carboxymethylaminomethyl(34) synthesis GTPase MnmE [Vicinamibacterales bacterium]|jgi:tRNA modification GTPase
MYSADDTIVALATPRGRGGLAVVRLSGPRAFDVARALCETHQTLEPRHATLVRLAVAERPGAAPRPIDEAIATAFAAPASYSGEDCVELSVHGSPVVVDELILAAVRAGARLAKAGEFTLRAFLNGRLDLTRAEAVEDLVSATTAAQARVAFDQLQGTLAGRIAEIERELFDLTVRLEASIDFAEEEFHFVAPGEVAEAVRRVVARIDELLAGAARGRLIREGATVAIVGRSNVGKSTLFNRLVGVDRAIVMATPGTTRDVLTEVVTLADAKVTLADTAGLRGSDDEAEREGVRRAELAGESADLAIVVLDGSSSLGDEDRRVLRATASRPGLVVVNKIDEPAAWEPGAELAEYCCGGSFGSGRGTTDGAGGWGVSEGCGGGEGGCRRADGQSGVDGREAEVKGRGARDIVCVSARTGEGIDCLIRSITRKTGALPEGGGLPAVSNARHVDLLVRARADLCRIGDLAPDEVGQMTETIILSDLLSAREALEEVTGKRTTEDLLEAIFSKFCIGK